MKIKIFITYKNFYIRFFINSINKIIYYFVKNFNFQNALNNYINKKLKT